MKSSLRVFFALCGCANSLQLPDSAVSRRSVLLSPSAAAATTIAALYLVPTESNAAQPNGLLLKTASSGIKWADAKEGSGQPLKVGAAASIDYSMASTAGRFPLIYSTKDTGTPYRWTLGDGSTIAGIELAIMGDDEIPPLLPGGIRRVIVPKELGYQSLLVGSTSSKCVEGGDGTVGPIPPKNSDGAYQRFVQFYCNPRIPYQPDLVLDIKLYGKRTI